MEQETKKQFVREKLPESKVKLVDDLVRDINNNRTFMIISIKSIPTAHLHKIKKKLAEKAKMKTLKKRVILRVIDKIERGRIKDIKNYVKENSAVLTSNIEPFELSAILAESKMPTKAKPGQEAIEEIIIEAGPTDLPAGPAVSELSSLGLKVSIEEGKINIRESKTIVKKGEKISQKAVDVMAKLDIKPFEIGIEPIVAYDSQEDEVYTELKIDKKKTIEDLKILNLKALGFARKIIYYCKETLGFLLAKASSHEKAFEKFAKEGKGKEQIAKEKIESKEEKKEAEDKPEEKKPEEAEENVQPEIKQEENQENKQEEK